MDTYATIIATAVVVFVAGLVRGFSGFGGALIFMPLGSALLDPKVAAAAFLVTDLIVALPVAVKSLWQCRWDTVLPAAIAAVMTLPVGVWILTHGDTITLRWTICTIAVVLLAILASGLRYRGEPHWSASVGVGAISGLFNGIGLLAGPPVIVYWMNGPYARDTIRANMFVYFLLMGCATLVTFLWNGLFTTEALRLMLVLVPAYAAALFFGARWFGRTAGAGYRVVALGVVALAALTSMPIFDAFLH